MQPRSKNELAFAWQALRVEADAGAREYIVESYMPFARMLAAKLYARRTWMELEFDDYFQCATLGLVESIDRFDPEQGASFEAFAEMRIKGAILNGIASLSERQQQASARKRAVASRVESVKDENAEPDRAEDLFSYLAEIAVGLAIGFVLEDTGMVQAEAEPAYPDNTYRRVEMRQLRKKMLGTVDMLPDLERKVISYHYLQRLAFVDIAGILNLSKARVSQLHKAALERLRNKLREEGAVDVNF